MAPTQVDFVDSVDTEFVNPVDPVVESVPDESAYDYAVDKIMFETGCTVDQADEGIEFIRSMIVQARSGERCDTAGTHHLTVFEMTTVGYGIMDDIMPHGATAEPGSAHAAVETLLLGATEFALVHDNPTGKAEDCIVTVSVRSV